ncbi:hypothetical protein [Actinomadura mexicana]|uniref:Uncharacterized protein n=1 Tax=Actinomadura mexicana TaxID=134959 RepID=A0A239E2E3_9ACTN|nr:hypothetical protein [Actinomadura mexicana]SNS38143.1 hypothetical protein SAMN06265355_11634 [Actinomadura mexicana]
MAGVLLLSAADVRAVFDLPAAIASQREAFGALGREAGAGTLVELCPCRPAEYTGRSIERT